MGANTWGALVGTRALEPPPFAGLELTATLVGLGLVALILATRRRSGTEPDEPA